MAAKDSTEFWRLFKTPHSNACPFELSAKFAAFIALMGAEPLPAPIRQATSGVSIPSSDYALNKDIMIEKLSSVLGLLQQGLFL